MGQSTSNIWRSNGEVTRGVESASLALRDSEKPGLSGVKVLQEHPK